MAFQPVPNTIGADVRCTLFGQQVENTLYFEQTGVPTASQVQACAEMVEEWFVTYVLPALSVSVVYREVYARSLVFAAAPEWTANGQTGDVGTNPVASLPGNVSWVVKFTSGLTGRSSRGRNFIFGIPEDQNVGNQIHPSFAAAMKDGYEQLMGIAVTNDFVWSIVSRRQNNVQLANGIAYPIVGVGFTDLDLDSQRRRLNGRGL